MQTRGSRVQKARGSSSARSASPLGSGGHAKTAHKTCLSLPQQAKLVSYFCQAHTTKSLPRLARVDRGDDDGRGQLSETSAGCAWDWSWLDFRGRSKRDETDQGLVTASSRSNRSGGMHRHTDEPVEFGRRGRMPVTHLGSGRPPCFLGGLLPRSSSGTGVAIGCAVLPAT